MDILDEKFSRFSYTVHCLRLDCYNTAIDGLAASYHEQPNVSIAIGNPIATDQ